MRSTLMIGAGVLLLSSRIGNGANGAEASGPATRRAGPHGAVPGVD